jgi:hypothetical protein
MIRIGAETAAAVREIGKVDSSLSKTATTGEKAQALIGRAAIPAAAALTALAAAGVASAKAAAEDQASREQLDGQIRRSTGATQAAVKANEDFIDSMSRQVAIADDELRPAMAQLVRATGDVKKSQDLLRLSADLAAATGKSLATTSAAVAKGYAGQMTSLKKLVPSLSDAAIKSKDWATVQAELNAQVAGAAKGQAQTAAGQYKALQISINELQESIGAALLPALQAVLPVATHFFTLAQGHTGVVLALAGAVAGLSAAVLVANAAIKVCSTVTTIWTNRQKIAAVATRALSGAQWLLNAALDANPIGVVVIALAALAAGLVIAYRHSATFRGIVQAAFGAAQSAAGALERAAGSLVRKFAVVVAAAGSVKRAVSAAFDAIAAAVDRVISAIERLLDKIPDIHLPSLPGLNMAGPTAALAAVPLGSSSSAGTTINVTVAGAIDPESTALAIRRVLERYDRRRGRRPLGGGNA